MTKKEALSIILKCASMYAENLCDRQLAFVYRDGNNHSMFVEVTFRSNNFMHFTGIEPTVPMRANEFYRNAIDKRLKESILSFKDNFTTENKLNILPSIMNIHYTARMIGDYAGPNIELYTEKVAGTTTACLSLIKKADKYIPNSVLNEDIRNIIPKPPVKIFAIFRKTCDNELYSLISFPPHVTILSG